jgi:hypothetical protein
MRDSGLIALFSILAGFSIILFLVAIVLYVLKSLGLYKLASNAGLENPWLAWLPFGDLYLLAKLVKGVKIGTFEVPRLELVLPIGQLIVLILSGIPVIGTILCIAFAVLLLFVLYKLFNIYKPASAVLWLVLSIILPFMGPIFIFMIRDERPVQY